MNIREQGVLIKNSLYRPGLYRLGLHSLCLFRLSIRSIFLSLLFLTYATTPTTALSEAKLQPDTNVKTHQIFIIHAPENKLQSRIAEALRNTLSQANADYVIQQITPDDNLLTIDPKDDLIVSIGRVSLENARRQQPDASNLFISTVTDTYKPVTKNHKKEAVLYITQPFCRQLGFISVINKSWHSVSILSSQKKPFSAAALNRCASEFDLKLHIVKTDTNGSLSRNIKDALEHSDILLAIPDKSIYNRKTVKNILLTSYRYRKPVIGFSDSFVRAGALASIHSSTDQIAESASHIIRDYFNNKKTFTKLVNYPQLFDVSINRQVFRALGIATPDIDKLKKDIVYTDAKASGLSK
jgi:hypothetical protein